MSQIGSAMSEHSKIQVYSRLKEYYIYRENISNCMDARGQFLLNIGHIRRHIKDYKYLPRRHAITKLTNCKNLGWTKIIGVQPFKYWPLRTRLISIMFYRSDHIFWKKTKNRSKVFCIGSFLLWPMRCIVATSWDVITKQRTHANAYTSQWPFDA